MGAPNAMNGLSKEAQLRGGSDQVRRRAERAGRRYRPGERNGPEDEAGVIPWDEATAEARTLNAEMAQRYGGRWFGACATVQQVLEELGFVNTRELTGRNALLVARLARELVRAGQSG